MDNHESYAGNGQGDLYNESIKNDSKNINIKDKNKLKCIDWIKSIL